MTGTIIATNNKRPRSQKDYDLLKIIGKRISSLRSETIPPMNRVDMIEQLKEKYGDVPGFNTSSMSAAERGERALSAYTLVCIAKFFNKPLSWFYGDELLKRETTILFGTFAKSNKHLLPVKLHTLPKDAVLSTTNTRQHTYTTGYYVIETEHDTTAVHIHKRLDNAVEVYDGICTINLDPTQFKAWQQDIKKSYRATHVTTPI